MNNNNKLIIVACVIGGVIVSHIIYQKIRNKKTPTNSPPGEREDNYRPTFSESPYSLKSTEPKPVEVESVVVEPVEIELIKIEKTEVNLKRENVLEAVEDKVLLEKKNRIPRVLKFPESTTLPTPERLIPRGGILSDVEKYRCGYPGIEDEMDYEGKPTRDNYLFYKNEIPMRPKNYKLDYIHENWWQNYEELERNHSYIQWLFPIREQGVNFQARPLQLAEIELMHKDPEILKRLLLSYILMLDFYGCKINEEGNLSRSENYLERYANMNDSTHNNLRITRILKCLGEFGFEDLKEKFMTHFIEEIWGNKKIPRCKQSCRNYWLGTIRDYKIREKLINKIIELEDQK